MVHPYNESRTHEFSSLINDHSQVTDDIQAFIMISDNYTSNAGFDSSIKNNVSISTVNSLAGTHLKSIILSQEPGTFMLGQFRRNF